MRRHPNNTLRNRDADHRDYVGGDGNALDSRYALLPELFLFNEGDANQTGGAILNAIQIREGKMGEEAIAALGGPSASGIPLPAPVAGQWDFDNGDLRATYGKDLEYIDPSLASN